jgi:hypothetical protein
VGKSHAWEGKEDAHDPPHTMPVPVSAYLVARSSVLAHAVLAEGVPAGQYHGDVHGAAVGLETNRAIQTPGLGRLARLGRHACLSLAAAVSAAAPLSPRRDAVCPRVVSFRLSCRVLWGVWECGGMIVRGIVSKRTRSQPSA